MRPIRLLVEVPLARAVAQNRTVHGEAAVELSDADISVASEAAKSLIVSGRRSPAHQGAMEVLALGGWCRLRVDEPTPAAALAALEALAAEDAKAQAQADAKQEARILDALAQSDEEWIGRTASADEPYTRAPGGLSYSDPRVADRVRAVEAGELFRARHEDWESRRRAARVAKEAAEEAAKQKALAEIEAIKTAARQFDDLKQAAAEGYDVEAATLDQLARRLTESIQHNSSMFEEGNLFTCIDCRQWVNTPDRSAPSPDSFKLLSAVKAAVALENEKLPAALRWTVSRIVRLNSGAEHKDHYFTAVLATLETSQHVRQVTCSLETQL